MTNLIPATSLLEEIKKVGYSPQSVAFGMGGGLLQKVNRDTMSFATKLSFIRYADGRAVDVMKRPRVRYLLHELQHSPL
jgi:nicotinic acid phosphoribosyltransferase